MALKTSLVLTGDASSATSALAQTDSALRKSAQEAARLSAAMAETDRSISKVASAQARAKQETAAATAAFKSGAITQDEYNRQLLETKTALSLVESEHRKTVNALNQTRAALGTATVSAGQAQAGYTNLGRQIQDVTVQLQGGANIGTIISQQGGQVADAVAQMGGRFAGFASFMAGPVGSVIILITGLLANQLIPMLFKSGDAADELSASFKKAALGSSGLAEAQTVLGQVFDLTSGKLKSQNELLILNARLTAINLRSEALAKRASSDKVFGRSGQRTFGDIASSSQTVDILDLPASTGERNTDAIKRLLAGVRSGKLSRDDALKQSERLDFKGVVVSKVEFQQAIIDAATADLNEKAASLIDKSLNTGQLAGGLIKPEKAKKPKKVADRTAELANFGDDTASKIANIRSQFADLPSEVKKSEQAVRQLDDILADIGRKKGLKPDVAIALRKEIEATKGVIQNSLNKPFSDYIEKAQQAAQIDALIAAGKYDQAEALKIVLALEERQPPLSQAQLANVLATVQAERDRALVLRDQGSIIQSQIRAVQDLRGALVDTVANFFRGRFSIERVLASIGNSYINITAQKIVEATFGQTLRRLEQQAAALDPVKQAGQQMAEQLRSSGDAVKSFADVVIEARNRIANGDAAPPDIPGADPTEIVVTGKRSPDVSGTGALFVDIIGSLMRDVLGVKLPPILGDVLAKSLGKLEKSLPPALAGAFTGASASRILLGDRGTTGTIGGAIGGALGQKFGEKFLSSGLEKLGGKALGSIAGPIGSVVGGLLGGLIGGLFATKPRGSGTVTQSSISVSANRDSVKSSLNTLGGQLQQSIQSIADRLGGTVGNYEVGFGQYKDYYQVSKTGKDPFLGQTYYQNKSPNALYDGKDAAAALSAAISDAVADGAIQGISSRVAAALKSSSDIDKAVREAVKVQDLELALGGIGEELRRQFAQFEQQAKERLRIARQYGFDVVAVEKRNAEDRVKLQEKLLKQQVGSLQQLIDDLTSGSLFEGSAVDQRTALLAQINKARADANAGVEGAADTLNQLLQQFNSVSKNVYGTTGGFADDRQQILDIARDAIAKANQRVAEAQKVTDPALAETNTQLNESNDQLAKLSAQTGISIDLLRQLVANTAGGSNIGALIQRARFQ